MHSHGNARAGWSTRAMKIVKRNPPTRRALALMAHFAVCTLAVILLPISRGQAPSSMSAVLRSFDRVLLLEEKGETSAGVNVGDLNGDGLPDIVLGKGRHWPLYNRVLLNDGKGGFTASNLGSAADRTYSAA